MMIAKLIKLEKVLNSIVLTLSGMMGLLYLVYGPCFAKWHLRIPSLSFPIFIGEIFLAICLILLMVKMCFIKMPSQRYHGLIIIYVVFVLMKTALGYMAWGALALRHAALFYYPLFAIIGYDFFDRSFLNQRMITLGSLAVILALVHGIYSYSIFPLFILGVLLITKIQVRWLRYVLLTLLLLAIPFHYHEMFGIVRTRIVSTAVGLITLCSLLLEMFVPAKRVYKRITLLVFVSFLTLYIFKVADQNTIKSMILIKPLMNKWDRLSVQISKGSKQIVFPRGSVRLFNDEGFQSRQPKPLEDNEPSLKTTVQNNNVEKNGIARSRSRESAENNILFRLFIWRDMLQELMVKKPLLGLDFGYPFNSPSLIALDWALEAWERDGWIAAHNSYLEIVFRAGVIGLIFLEILFWTFFRMCRQVLRKKILAGIFLISIIVYWFVVACFGVFFELPYNAIVFWLLYGMMFAYVFNSGQKDENTGRA